MWKANYNDWRRNSSLRRLRLGLLQFSGNIHLPSSLRSRLPLSQHCQLPASQRRRIPCSRRRRRPPTHAANTRLRTAADIRLHYAADFRLRSVADIRLRSAVDLWFSLLVVDSHWHSSCCAGLQLCGLHTGQCSFCAIHVGPWFQSPLCIVLM